MKINYMDSKLRSTEPSKYVVVVGTYDYILVRFDLKK